MTEHELYHHGILGMKWGIRKYQNEDGSLTSLGKKRYNKVEKEEQKSQSAKTTLGKKYHARNAEQMRAEIKRAENVRNVKGIGNKFSEAFGYGAGKTMYEGKAKEYKRASELSKTKLGRRINETKSANASEMAKYNEKMQKSDAGKKFFETMIYRGEWVNTPYHRLSGREITQGREFYNKVLTLGLAGLVGDAVYLATNKNN